MDERKIEKILLVMLISLSLCAYGLTIRSITKTSPQNSFTEESEVACVNA